MFLSSDGFAVGGQIFVYDNNFAIRFQYNFKNSLILLLSIALSAIF